jgi:hypothetical protein
MPHRQVRAGANRADEGAAEAAPPAATYGPQLMLVPTGGPIRSPGPKVMISLARIVIPPQIGAGRLSIGNETGIKLAGTATKAIRDSCSSQPTGAGGAA